MAAAIRQPDSLAPEELPTEPERKQPSLMKSTQITPGSPLPVVTVADAPLASSAEYLAENAAATQQASTTSPCRILTRRT
jgi:hypothetical protein